MLLFYFYLFSFLVFHASTENEIVTVEIDDGILASHRREKNGFSYVTFKGVPYAKPPIGDLRFKRPQPPESWGTKRYFENYESVCPQSGRLPNVGAKSRLKNQKENCLYLNIFTPSTDGRETYPVVVWIHGGSFVVGSGNVDIEDDVVADRFLKNDVILVTINYRLGVLGFMAGRDRSETNLGLWDMLESLRWINRNIHAFGGDPKLVTVMGESAGGAAASILALTEKTEGLVHRAIVMSGSILSHFGARPFEDDIIDYNLIFNLLTSCPKVDPYASDLTKSVLERCCQHVPDDFDCGKLGPYDCVMRNLTLFAEGEPLSALRFCLMQVDLTQPVVDWDMIEGDKYPFARHNPKVPVMLGVAEFEWGILLNDAQNGENIASEIEWRVNRSYPSYLRQDITDAVQHFYLNGKSMNDDIGENGLRAIGDMEMAAPTYAEAVNYARKDQPVYLYNFAHVSTNPVAFFGRNNSKDNLIPGAFHGLDHAYIFSNGVGPLFNFTYDEEDKIVADNFTRYITNFAKYGNPNAPGKDETWPRFLEKEPAYLNIRNPVEQKPRGFHEKGVKFFNSFLPRLLDIKDNDFSSSALRQKQEVKPLTKEEKSDLNAYKHSWWVLWALVGVLAVIFLFLLCYLCFKLKRSKTSKKTRTVSTMTYKYT